MRANIQPFFIKKCVLCREKTYRFSLCKRCFYSIQRISGPICLKCGYPYPVFFKSCNFCQEMLFNSHRSMFMYEGVIRELVSGLKYNHKTFYAGILKNLFKSSLPDNNMNIYNYDLLIPVPINSFSYWKRGFNQSELIAKPISKISKTPLFTELIWHRLSLKKQHTLNRVNRAARENPFVVNSNVYLYFNYLFNKFFKSEKLYVFKKIHENLSCEKKLLTDFKLLLVDDVATTFNTLNNLCEILYNAGAKIVDCISLARTPFEKNSFFNVFFL